MANSNVDWAAQSSLVEDQQTVPLLAEQKRRVQRICVQQALNPDGTVDTEQALEFMMALGVHPTQTDADITPVGPPSPSAALTLRSPNVLNSLNRGK